MRDIDWKILYELHRTPNITKVADKLYMTQPTLTKRLQSIENELNVRVVNRSTKGVQFTSEGEYLAQQAESYLQFRGSIERGLEAFRAQGAGTIRVASSISFAAQVLPELIADYRVDHPSIAFDIEYAKSNKLLPFLKEGVSDLAFVRGVYRTDLTQKRLFSEQAYVLSSAPITMEDLDRLPYIQFVLGEYSSGLVERWWSQQPNKPRYSSITVRLIEAAIAMVKEGLGYTIGFFDENKIKESGLYALPLFYSEGAPLLRDTWMIYSEPMIKSPAVRDFIDMVEQRYHVCDQV